MPITPYVVGQWVRGDNFYGRDELIDVVLNGNRNCIWLLGTRRIGKTSILKQLEYLTSESPDSAFFPVFWDFQGAEEPQDLHDSFDDSLLDAAERLEELDIDLEQVESDDLMNSIGRLRRVLRKRKKKLLLLGDEVEELVTINEKAPQFLRRLRRALQSSENIRSVLASKIKLWDLAYQETSTSPFLHGFTPPLFVYGLSDQEARSLIAQSQLPLDARPDLDPKTIEVIRAPCNNHPYLLQLLSERYQENGDLKQAIDEIASDQMVSHFFNVDFDMLTDTERKIIIVIGEQSEASLVSIEEKLSASSSNLRGSLQRLEHLGFIHQKPDGDFFLANYFFERWFSDQVSKRRTPFRVASRGLELTATEINLDDTEGQTLLIDERYELLARLGRGATGQVFKAYDTLLKTVIAMKILNQDHFVDADALERLRREVILSRDLGHPNIVKIYHLGDDEDLKYITMQFVDGPTLADILAKEPVFQIPRVLDIAKKLTSALSAAHRCHVLHRDIKPANILVDSNGEPRITDFGLARLMGGPSVTKDGVFLGTPAYAAPEQIMAEEIDERSDIYALGVVIFEMATGQRPFVADATNQVLMMHLNVLPPSPREIRSTIPSGLSDTILKCLEKNPAQRYQNADQLLVDLDLVK